MGGPGPVLHFGESRYTGGVEGDDLPVENDMMITEIICQRTQLGVFLGNLASVARSQPHCAVISLDQ